ncbi:MFS transporter [Endozoicomonas sp. SM1973]|uniref:MFS transporter n=1 Tax=Spartinivicinus marinus TaxID=2994442 RepID=A0A853ICS1_9GAMM|nr:MFS transporter [Spartinivicinus marinus]MCX4025964.1 MFS transporter [Spartinivicinus marinus]NYZ67864.1 MFS transporter [Spartinivicinus marinus]
MHPNEEKSQFGLLKRRRFLPFFLTQFFGAFNDNIFKNSLVFLVTFNITQFGSQTASISEDILINIAVGLFILPFFLFSALAGQIADKYEKSQIIRRVKILEICIMLTAAVAFYFNNLWLLLFILFLMGTQSAFFGPVKYAIIPQHLYEDELVGGNAFVEMGTFLAILFGTIAGGLLASLEMASTWISISIIVFAIIGYICSREIPEAPASAPSLKISWNPVTEAWRIIKQAKQSHSVFLSIMAISWFWFLGAAYLTQLPNFTEEILRGAEGVVTSLLAAFSIGIGLGSMSCERLSGHKIEIGIVPIGSIGLTIFGVDLFFATQPSSSAELLSFTEFFRSGSNYRVLIDMTLIGFFGGLFIVPLYALIQHRTPEEYRAQVIAANNIINSMFMVVSALCGILFIGVAGLTITQFFLVLALLNAVIAVYVYSTVPEFAMRFLIYLLTHTMYRVRSENINKIPDDGPGVIVCNHVSYVDALLLAGTCHRPVRFVMYKPIYDLPVLNFIFRVAKAIPITSRNQNPDTFNAAFERISEALKQGELVCIFPEGKLTKDGEINEFKRGIEKIIERDPVPVIPMALRGLWGSFFSHKGGHALTKRPKRFWSKVSVITGDLIQPEAVSADKLQEVVLNLRGEAL